MHCGHAIEKYSKQVPECCCTSHALPSHNILQMSSIPTDLCHSERPLPVSPTQVRYQGRACFHFLPPFFLQPQMDAKIYAAPTRRYTILPNTSNGKAIAGKEQSRTLCGHSLNLSPLKKIESFTLGGGVENEGRDAKLTRQTTAAPPPPPPQALGTKPRKNRAWHLEI